MPDDEVTDGWNYLGNPPAGGDCRKLVTLVSGGMTWVGIRAFHHANGFWMNNGEPERDTVKAWRDLPEPAHGFWEHGVLHFPDQDHAEAVAQMMLAMPGPTLPEGDPYD